MRAAALFVFIAIFGLGPPKAGAEQLRISAGVAPLENIYKKIAEPFEKATGIHLVLKKATHVTSLEDLDQGKADIASVGFRFEDWIDRAKKDGLKISTPIAEFKNRVVGHDNLLFAVNKSNHVDSLSSVVLRRIFSGEAKSWDEVGGEKSPIVVFVADDMPGLNGLIRQLLLDGKEFSPAAQHVSGDAKRLLDLVKKTPSAIAFVPSGSVDPDVSIPKAPEIGRPVVAVTKGIPSPAALKLFDFISRSGSDFLK